MQHVFSRTGSLTHAAKIHFLGTVILRTHKASKSNSFSNALFRTLTVAPSVGLFGLDTQITIMHGCWEKYFFLLLANDVAV
jgi:hypothetical protein